MLRSGMPTGCPHHLFRFFKRAGGTAGKGLLVSIWRWSLGRRCCRARCCRPERHCPRLKRFLNGYLLYGRGRSGRAASHFRIC